MRTAKALLVALLFALIALFAHAPSARGQPLPQDIILAVPSVRQDTEVWCWVAAAQMNIQYRNGGNAPSQCRMLELGYGLPPGGCCGHEQNCMRGGYIPEIQSLIHELGGTISSIAPPTDPMSLYISLARDQPVVGQVRVQGGASTHFVVIRGMIFRPVPVFVPGVGPTVQMMPFVIVNDPLGLIQRPVPYPEFLSWWMAAIVIGPNISATTPGGSPQPPTPQTSSTSTGSGASPPERSSFCKKLDRVINASDTFDSIQGAPLEDPDARFTFTDKRFKTSVKIPNAKTCHLEIDESSHDHVYICTMNTVDEDACDDLVDPAKEYAKKAQACYPTWKAKTDATVGRTLFGKSFRSPDAPTSMTIGVDRDPGDRKCYFEVAVLKFPRP